MITFSQIPELEAYDWLSPMLATERQEIEDAFDGIVERRAALAANVSKVADADVASLDYEQIQAAEKARRDQYNLLQSELVLREQRLKPFYDKQRKHGSQTRKELEAELQQIEAEVAADLEGIGYVPHVPNRTVPGSWRPEMVLVHPRHFGNRQKAEGVRIVSSNYDVTRRNDEAVAALRATLESFRRFAVG